MAACTSARPWSGVRELTRLRLGPRSPTAIRSSGTVRLVAGAGLVAVLADDGTLTATRTLPLPRSSQPNKPWQ